jgi:hypothetical protein
MKMQMVNTSSETTGGPWAMNTWRDPACTFLDRLEPPKRRTTFTSYILDAIHGNPWRLSWARQAPLDDPALIAQEVESRLVWVIHQRSHTAPDHHQWFDAIYHYRDEFMQLIDWYIQWEHLTKREKQRYRWQQYQRWQATKAEEV